MDLHEKFREKKEALLSDLRKSITYTPDRGHDLYTMMHQYLNAEPEDREPILQNILRCGSGQPYPDPSAGDYACTEADIQKVGETIDRYLAALSGCGGDGEAIQQALAEAVREINALEEAAEHGLIDTWRREELCGIMNGAAEQAGAEPREDMTFSLRMW